MLGVRHLFSQRAQTGEKRLIECSWFVFAVPECLSFVFGSSFLSADITSLPNRISEP